MKTLFKATLVAATVLASLVSCNTEQDVSSGKKEVHFVLKAKMPETKTGAEYGEGTYLPYFQKGDALGVLFEIPTAKGDLSNDAVFYNVSEDGEDAAFEGTVSLDEGEGITFYSYYPADAGKKVYVSDGETTLGIDVSSTQTPAFHNFFGYSFDPRADILVAKPATCSVVDETGFNDVDMYFSRVTGVLRVALNMAETVTGYGERISKFVMETSAGDIAGRVVVNPITGEYSKTNSLGTSKTITATFDVDAVPVYVGIESTNNVFLCTAPVTIPAGSTLTFIIETVDEDGQAAHKIVKTVSSTPKDIVFRSGESAVINLTIQESEVSASDDSIDYSGYYLITNVAKSLAALAWNSSDNNLKTAEISYSADTDQVTYDEDVEIDLCKMTVTKVSSGDYEGMYTIQDANGLYLYAASSGSNHLKGYSELDKNGYWTISNTEGNWSIIATQSTNRNVMQFNGSLVSCYGSSSQSPVVLFSWDNVVLNTTPQIKVEETTKTVAASATTVGFTYTTKNIDGEPSAIVTSDEGDMIVNAVVAEGTVTVTLNPNTENVEKTAEITLSLAGAADVVLTIIQEAFIEDAWTLVEDATVLSAGDLLIITNVDATYAISTNQATNNRTATAVTANSSKKMIDEISENVQVVTLEGDASGWYFNVGTDDYLYASSSSQNQLKTASKMTAGNNGKWEIDIANNRVQAQGTYTRNLLRFNPNNNNPIFACYAYNSTTGTTVKLYRKPGIPDERTEVTMSFSPAEPAAITFGDSFTEPTLTVEPSTAPVTYSIETTPDGIATIDENNGQLSIISSGTITVTASVSDEENYKPASTSYTLVVNAPVVAHGSVDNPMSPADIVAIIADLDNKVATSDFYYVEGYVTTAATTVYNGGKMTFTISDSNNSNPIVVYNCLGLNGAAFTSTNDLKVGDYVVVYGNLEKFNTQNEIVNGQLARLTTGSSEEERSVAFLPADFSGQGTSGTGGSVSATKDGITFACDKGYGTTQLRCYSGGEITISAPGVNISRIQFTFSGSNIGGLDSEYKDINATSWSAVLSSQARFTEIRVFY